MQKPEPIFSPQEQAVVYLFSRYWEAMSEFRGRKISRIHTHFPDFCFDNSDGKVEAIEFEYGLSGFRSHLGDSLQKLRVEGIRLLHIVYWDEDDDEKDLCRRIRKAGFKGKVKCVCLKKRFKARVSHNRQKEALSAAWEFSKRRSKPAYPYAEIKEATDRLAREGAIKRLKICSTLYRTTGFDRNEADFIECDHWRNIHFYTTTTKFREDSIPSKLFVRPSGCSYFEGCFEIEIAFKVTKPTNPGESIKKFFKDFYFFEYGETPENEICFAYSDFKLLSRVQGKRLFGFLDDRYNLHVRGAMLIRREDNATIDRIIQK